MSTCILMKENTHISMQLNLITTFWRIFNKPSLINNYIIIYSYTLILVVTVLQELADTLIEDEVKRITLRARFLRLLEDAEHTLFIDLQQSLSSGENDDGLVVHAKLKAAKQRLEDACFTGTHK